MRLHVTGVAARRWNSSGYNWQKQECGTAGESPTLQKGGSRDPTGIRMEPERFGFSCSRTKYQCVTTFQYVPSTMCSVYFISIYSMAARLFLCFFVCFKSQDLGLRQALVLVPASQAYYLGGPNQVTQLFQNPSVLICKMGALAPSQKAIVRTEPS